MLLDVIASSRRRGFNPLSLSPALWLDASDASTLFDATTGGSLVAADGAVARWEDKSGNTRHATQATSGARPVRKTSVQNGRDVVRFDGEDDFLLPASNPMTGAASGMLFIVAKNDHDPPISAFSAGHPFGQTGNFGSHLPWEDGVIYENFGTTVRKVVGNPATSLESPFIYNVLSASAQYAAWLNGTQIFSTTSNAVGASGILIGTGAPFAYKGIICEILVFPTALSTTDRQAVESYLATKWGITLAS
jgi:hypothetical protein